MENHNNVHQKKPKSILPIRPLESTMISMPLYNTTLNGNFSQTFYPKKETVLFVLIVTCIDLNDDANWERFGDNIDKQVEKKVRNYVKSERK